MPPTPRASKGGCLQPQGLQTTVPPTHRASKQQRLQLQGAYPYLHFQVLSSGGEKLGREMRSSKWRLRFCPLAARHQDRTSGSIQGVTQLFQLVVHRYQQPQASDDQARTALCIFPFKRVQLGSHRCTGLHFQVHGCIRGGAAALKPTNAWQLWAGPSSPYMSAMAQGACPKQSHFARDCSCSCTSSLALSCSSLSNH